jgi:hypothetical protein
MKFLAEKWKAGVLIAAVVAAAGVTYFVIFDKGAESAASEQATNGRPSESRAPSQVRDEGRVARSEEADVAK